MYGCEKGTIKKAEHQRIDAFKLRCWRRLFRVPWTARRSHQSTLKPREGGAWWATVYGVAQSRTRLKWLSSSSSSRCYFLSVININKIISAHTQKSLITQGNLLFLWTFRDGILLMPPNIGKKGFEALCSVMALLCSYTYVLIDYILLLPVLISII